MANPNGNGSLASTLWATADRLRGHMDAAEYKHVVLGLTFLKYISDAFHQIQDELVKEKGADPEDPDEYRAKNAYWVPPEARWDRFLARAHSPEIGGAVDDAMIALEKENPSLKGVLPKDFARPDLDKSRLGELVELVNAIGFHDDEHDDLDVFGRVYEYFLGKFALAEGRRSGEYFTPRPVVKLLVEMLEPFEGRVYDPCCGSGGMFVQARRFVQEHKGRLDQVSIYGQESNPTTWKLARMNLAIRGIDGDLGKHHADTFHNDLHRDKKFDFILANPPFNMKAWGQEKLVDDPRWKHGIPPKNNANYAWVQHIVHHLSPAGTAGFILANGSMSSQQSGEGEIRKSLIEADLVDCMVALPSQMFYSTQIPACLWFLARDRANGKFRDRRGEILFIDARNLGEMVDRTHRELIDDDIERIARTYHAWRGEKEAGTYEDVPGFCKSTALEEVRRQGHVLTPGRYVGSEAAEEDDEPLEDKMARLATEWTEQVRAGRQLDDKIEKNLEALGFAAST